MIATEEEKREATIGRLEAQIKKGGLDSLPLLRSDIVAVAIFFNLTLEEVTKILEGHVLQSVREAFRKFRETTEHLNRA